MTKKSKMAKITGVSKLTKKNLVSVREHPRHVPPSKKNPEGITIVDHYLRRPPGTSLSPNDIISTVLLYPRGGLKYPSNVDFGFRDDAKYDELIGIWTDYFNKKFGEQEPLDPDIVKALTDPKSEAKDFIFTEIRKRDLKSPDIAIPMGVRWLFRKKRLAEGKLGRPITPEELILEYKGLLKSKSSYREDAIENFRINYGKLKGK